MKKLNIKDIIFILVFLFIILFSLFILYRDTGDDLNAEQKDGELVEEGLQKEEPIFMVLSPSDNDSYVGITVFCIYNDGKKGMQYFAVDTMDNFIQNSDDISDIRQQLKNSYEDITSSDMSEVFAAGKAEWNTLKTAYQKQYEISNTEMKKEIDLSTDDHPLIYVYGTVLDDKNPKTILYYYDKGKEKAVIDDRAGEEVLNHILDLAG